MTANIRLAIAALVTGLAFGQAPALAQNAVVPAAPPAANTSDQVGPRELKDFSLPGTVTRRADPTPATTSRPAPTNPPAVAPPSSAANPAKQPAATPVARPIVESSSAAERPTVRPRPEKAAQTELAAPPLADRTAASITTTQLPPVSDSPSDSAAAAASAPSLPANQVPWPWLVAAAMVLAGAGAWLWRNRQRQAFAGGPTFDSFEAPVSQPTAAPRPAPLPRAPEPKPQFTGVVSSRLRPWLELSFRPTNCIITEQEVTFEFELTLFNSGSVPAREILVEASYFNAAPTQDQDLERFFANPAGEGPREISLNPLKRLSINTRLVTPRAQVREYEAGGRRVFVPLIGFNALYRWSNSHGQTSVGYMVGRSIESEKLAPFRLDMTGRQFHSLGQRLLPPSLRQ